MKSDARSNYPIRLGCTWARHQRIGIDVVVNARGGLQHLNDDSIEEIELRRDAQKIRDWFSGRVTIHQFNSRYLRSRNIERVKHLLAEAL